MERRMFLGAGAGAAWAMAAATGSQKLFEIDRVAEGVWSVIANPMVVGNCNGAVFELSDGLVVVDTHVRPSASQYVLNEIRKQTKKPVKYVVLTHIHGDHVQGMGTYLKLTPRPVFVTHAATRKRMVEGGNPVTSVVSGAEKALAAAESQLAKAGAGGEKEFLARSVAERKSFLAEMKTAVMEAPAVSVTRDFVIHDKMGDVQVMFRGMGHTDGDLCVYSPQRKVIATGDLAVSTTPGINQWIYHWPRTLNGFATECDFDQVIPGHGGVQKGRQRFAQLGDYLEELLNVVQTRRRGGKTAADLKKEITAESLVSLKGGYAEYLGEQIFRYRLLPGVTNAGQALRTSIQGNIDQVYNVVGQL